MKRKSLANAQRTKPRSQITHITINTGHTCEVPRGKFTREHMRMFRQLVKHGGGYIPDLGKIHVVISQEPGCAVFSFRDDSGQPFLANALAWTESGAALLWDLIKSWDQGIYEFPARPECLPWLVSLVMKEPEIPFWEYLEVIMYLASFEQGLATAIIANATSSDAI